MPGAVVGDRARLTGDDIASGLVAIYVVEGPESEYNDDPSTFGRVVALVRPLPMPPGKTIKDYPSGCQHLKGNFLVDRWPIGWPSEVVFFSNHGGPVLRDVVKTATGRSDYATFTHQLLQGPIDLMRTGHAPIRHQLMREIPTRSHEIQKLRSGSFKADDRRPCLHTKQISRYARI